MDDNRHSPATALEAQINYKILGDFQILGNMSIAEFGETVVGRSSFVDLSR